MAKSSRASVVKAKNAKLKARVFKPVEDARARRLSAKLMELAAQPKPERDVDMDVDPAAALVDGKNPAQDEDVIMEEETAGATSKRKSQTKKPQRVQKKRRAKSSSSITFAIEKKARSLKRKSKKKT